MRVVSCNGAGVDWHRDVAGPEKVAIVPIDMFFAAAIINRWIAVPVLALVAAAYRFETFEPTGHIIGFIAYCSLYGFMGKATRHFV